MSDLLSAWSGFVLPSSDYLRWRAEHTQTGFSAITTGPRTLCVIIPIGKSRVVGYFGSLDWPFFPNSRAVESDVRRMCDGADSVMQMNIFDWLGLRDKDGPRVPQPTPCISVGMKETLPL